MIHMGIIFYIDDTAWTIWIHHDTPLESWLLPCDHPASHCQAAESRRFPLFSHRHKTQQYESYLKRLWKIDEDGYAMDLTRCLRRSFVQQLLCASRKWSEAYCTDESMWKLCVNSANSAKKRCWNWSSNALQSSGHLCTALVVTVIKQQEKNNT